MNSSKPLQPDLNWARRANELATEREKLTRLDTINRKQSERIDALETAILQLCDSAIRLRDALNKPEQP
jgi:hypothetical protein